MVHDVNLLNGELSAHHLISSGRGLDTGKRIDHVYPVRRFAPCLDRER